MENKFLKMVLKLFLICVPFILYFTIEPVNTIINQIFDMLRNVDVQAIKSYILSFGIWAPVISYLIMLFQSLVAPLPSFVVTFVNAGLFGWWKGALLSWCGTLSGAVMCFWIARFFGRDVVAKFTTKGALVSVDKFFDRYGKYAVLTARLLPFVSFDVISYGAGLTAMSFWSFFWATAIGQLPVTIVYSYVGGMLTGSAKTVVIGLLLMVSVGVLIFMLRKIWKDRNRTKVNE
jgi:uncharacterized membrane protein YdjX (TVP38/TMEM64 family)